MLQLKQQWIHVRNVALPMSFLYGIKFVGEMTPLTLALREVSSSSAAILERSVS